MRDILLIIYFRIKEMPFLLRFFFVFCMLSILFTVGSIIPMVHYQVEGQEITYQEWWASGNGIAMASTGLLFFITGIGIFRKTKWARIAFLFSIFIPVFLTPVRPPVDYILGLLAYIVIFGCYLFLKKSVKNYFTTRHYLK